MAKFNFKIEEFNGFKKIDEFEFWISADNRPEAWSIIEKAYPGEKGYYVSLLNIE
jgi:hypothetical protein